MMDDCNFFQRATVLRVLELGSRSLFSYVGSIREQKKVSEFGIALTD
jgi:hypothetical protein